MATYDYIVVGGGMAGVSLAAQLSQHAPVLVLEREHAIGYHSTGRSAALYTALYGNAVVMALTRASRTFFDAPPSGFAPHPLLKPRGVLYAGGAGDLEAIRRLWGPGAHRISTEEAMRRVPVLVKDSAIHCAFEPAAFDIDVNAVHEGFRRLAKARGAEIVCGGEVIALQRGPSKWTVQSTRGTDQARVLVNAAGAWADQIASLAGIAPIGLQPLRRTAMVMDSPDPGSSSWPAVIAADESFYFKPDAGRLLLSPADETPSAPCDAQPEELDVAVCVDRIEARTRLRVKRVLRSWAGLRTFSPDRTPVVGFDPTQPDFFWLAGQGGYGIQAAPALSEISAALCLARPMPDHIVAEGVEVATLTPDRYRRF